MGSPERGERCERSPAGLQVSTDLLSALADMSEEENELYEQGDKKITGGAAAAPVCHQSAANIVPAGGAGRWSLAALTQLLDLPFESGRGNSEAMRVERAVPFHVKFLREAFEKKQFARNL